PISAAASVAVTVRVPAVLPVAVPGAAISPGNRICSLVAAPAFTVTLALALAVNVPPASVAVMVRVPTVLKVKLDKVRVPATRVMFPAMAPLSSALTALVSVLLIVTLGPALVTTFQLASTALTTMPLAIAVPAVCAVGVAAVLPVAVPGAATSPGSRICSLVTAPALTVIGGLVLAALLPSLMSVAVRVQLPTVLLVRLKDLVPATSAVLTGNAALASVEARPTVSMTLGTTFQFASTALTVTL